MGSGNCNRITAPETRRANLTRHTIWTQWGTGIESHGHLLLGPDTRNLATDDLSDVTVYVPRYMSGAAGLQPITRMPELRLLQLPYAGYDDALQVLPEGVTLCNAGEVHTQSTAELAVALMLASSRGLDHFARNQLRGEWKHESLKSLSGKSALIVGFGSIGRKIAEMLAPFDVATTGITRTGRDETRPLTELDSLLPCFDFVVLVTPANAESKHLINERRLGLLKDGALLVNVSRGSTVDTEALVAQLATGRISAALDVTEPEPLPANHPLWQLDNVLISPHVGGDSSAFEPRMLRLLDDQLARLAADQPLLHVVSGSATL